MDGRTYIEEIKTRMHRYLVAANVSDLEILSYLNIVRKTVFTYAKKAIPERFGRIAYPLLSSTPVDTLSVKFKNIYMYPTSLPDNFTEELVVKVVWLQRTDPDDPASVVEISRQARKAEHGEVHNISMNSWTEPFLLSPIYNIGDSEGATTRLQKSIFIGGLDYADNPGHSLFDDAFNGEIAVEIWYIAMPDDLEYDDNETIYVGDMQELVILNTILMCLKRSTPDATYPILKNDIDQLTKMIQSNYDGIIAERELNLETKQ